MRNHTLYEGIEIEITNEAAVICMLWAHENCSYAWNCVSDNTGWRNRTYTIMVFSHQTDAVYFSLSEEGWLVPSTAYTGNPVADKISEKMG